MRNETWNGELTAFWYSPEGYIAWNGILVNNQCSRKYTGDKPDTACIRLGEDGSLSCACYYYEVKNETTGNVERILNNNGDSLVTKLQERILTKEIWEDPGSKCEKEFNESSLKIENYKEMYKGSKFSHFFGEMEGLKTNEVYMYDKENEFHRLICNGLLYNDADRPINMLDYVISGVQNKLYNINGCETGMGKAITPHNTQVIYIIMMMQIIYKYVFTMDVQLQINMDYDPVPIGSVKGVHNEICLEMDGVVNTIEQNNHTIMSSPLLPPPTPPSTPSIPPQATPAECECSNCYERPENSYGVFPFNTWYFKESGCYNTSQMGDPLLARECGDCTGDSCRGYGFEYFMFAGANFTIDGCYAYNGDNIQPTPLGSASCCQSPPTPLPPSHPPTIQ